MYIRYIMCILFVIIDFIDTFNLPFYFVFHYVLLICMEDVTTDKTYQRSIPISTNGELFFINSFE